MSCEDRFIVYACPVGELAQQLDRYFAKSRMLWGENTAHQYMPHCSLTGFFREELDAIPLYLESLDSAVTEALPSRPEPAIAITGLSFRSDWHGLELDSPWLKQAIANFAKACDSPTRREPLRLKGWLHLSLAYDFPPEQTHSLQKLAEELIFIDTPVQWELRFYQRDSQKRWTCHYTRSI